MLFKKFNMNVPNNYSIGTGSVWMELAPYGWSWLHIDGAGSISMELAPYISIDGAGSISIWSWLHNNLELAPYRNGSWLHINGAGSMWIELAPYGYGSWLHVNLELAPYRYGAGSISI